MARATVDQWIAKSKKRMTAIFRQAAQETVYIAQTPKAKGGRLPVDTGFLRASGKASSQSRPSGPGSSSEAPGLTEWTEGELISVLASIEIGDTFYWGWTANYARLQEERNGFNRGAVELWPRTVDKVIAEAKRRYR